MALSLDIIDIRLLNELQVDADRPNVELARLVGLSPAATLNRVRRLKESGVVRAIQARLDSAAAGFALQVYVLVTLGRHDEAAEQLAAVRPDVDWDARVEALKQAIGFARAGGSEGELAGRVAADPADLESRLALAGVLAARRSWREAMDQLLEIVRRDKAWRNGEARKQLLAIFNLAAAETDLVSEYRRKLAGVLY